MRACLPACACAVCPAAAGTAGMLWAEVWRRRGALAYTVGAWTVFGSVIYYSSRYIGQTPEEVREKPAGNETVISEDGLRERTTYMTPGRNFYVESTVVYKPNFVPYTTRLHNYVQSFFENSGDKGK